MILKKLKKKLIEKTYDYKYDLQQYETIRLFLESIYTGKINIDEAEMDQTNLLENLAKFDNKSRPISKEENEKKKILMKVHMLFIKVKN